MMANTQHFSLRFQASLSWGPSSGSPSTRASPVIAGITWMSPPAGPHVLPVRMEHRGRQGSAYVVTLELTFSFGQTNKT